MSAHLPENVEQWPRDPYALLGVNRGTDRRDVRRAYSRLIRLYKPEHHPDQFQRIRDAFETIERYAAWQAEVAAPGEEEFDTAPLAEAVFGPSAEAQAELLDDDASHEPAADEHAPSGPAFDGDALWRAALNGTFVDAYSQFAQLANRGAADEETYARLFWLLRIDRSLDPARDPRDWLVSGMKRCGLRGRLPGLYGSELTEDVQEALHRRAEEALRCSGHPGLLAEMVIARWDAAVRLEKWDLIPRDLTALRGRLHEEPAAWSRLLLAAIDRLSWAPAKTFAAVLDECRKEIEQLAEHWPDVATELNERDGLAELVTACDQLDAVAMDAVPDLPAAWRRSLRELLRHSWNRPLSSFRDELLDVLRPLAQNPIVGMECLDRLEARCRPAFHRLGALITMLFNESCAGRQPPPAKELLDRLVDFLVAASKKSYPDQCKKWLSRSPGIFPFGRREILMFCIEESIAPRLLVHFLAESLRQDMMQFIAPAENAPLNFACLAYQAFWA